MQDKTPSKNELNQEEAIKLFRSQRNEALLSLNEQKIREFYRFWNDEELPSDPKVFWLAVHKAITGCKDLPLVIRQRSKLLLNSVGSSSEDDGDL